MQSTVYSKNTTKKYISEFPNKTQKFRCDPVLDLRKTIYRKYFDTNIHLLNPVTIQHVK